MLDRLLQEISAEVNVVLMSFPQSVNANKALIDHVLAQCHALRIVHLVSLPVTELAIAARLIQVRRLANDKLTDPIDVRFLTATQEAHDRSCLYALAHDKFTQIELFVQPSNCLIEHLLVNAILAPSHAEETHDEVVKTLQRLHLEEVSLHLAHDIQLDFFVALCLLFQKCVTAHL